MALVVVGCGNDWDLLDPRIVSPSDAGVGPAECGTIRVLREDFAVPELPGLWSKGESNAEVKFDDGKLVFDLPDDLGDAYALLRTLRRYDLRYSEVVVEVVGVPEQSDATSTHFQLSSDSTNALRLVLRDGALRAETRTNAYSWSEVASTTFDQTEHRWWRLREDGASTHWETAAQSQGPWTGLAAVLSATLFPLDYLQLELRTDTTVPTAPAGSTSFDNVNGGVETQPRCKISTLTDDFEDGFRSRAWLRSEGDEGSTGVEYGGELVLSLSPARSNADYRYISSRGYDLREDAVVVRLGGELDAAVTAEASLTLEHDHANDMSIRVRDGELSVVVEQDGGDQEYPVPPGVDAAIHRWWRIRESSGTTHFEVSDNAADWIELSSLSTSFPLDQVDVRLGAYTEEELTSTAVVRFDNFNLP